MYKLMYKLIDTSNGTDVTKVYLSPSSHQFYADIDILPSSVTMMTTSYDASPSASLVVIIVQYFIAIDANATTASANNDVMFIAVADKISLANNYVTSSAVVMLLLVQLTLLPMKRSL